MKSGVWWALLVVLLGGVGLIVAGELRVPARTFDRKLEDLLPPPSALPGWTVEKKPIADSPEMKQAVGELLNYDDGVFAIYTRGARRISVYMAYWTPGRMSHRLVAGHTPDVCWVAGGWKRLEGGAAEFPAGGSASTQPGEMRVFSQQGITEHVVFWHLVGGTAKSYGTGTEPPWWAPLADMWTKGLDQRDEQFFVRISSNEPVTGMWNEPWVRQVAAAVPGLVAR